MQESINHIPVPVAQTSLQLTIQTWEITWHCI